MPNKNLPLSQKAAGNLVLNASHRKLNAEHPKQAASHPITGRF
jgi:hypothetical protein